MNNPYSAPQASLSRNSSADDTYEPKMLAIDGRIGRMRYIAYGMTIGFAVYALFGLLALVFGAAAVGFGDAEGGEAMGVGMMIVLGLLYIPLLISTFVYAVRRLNDLNKSGWWSLTILIPLLNLVPIIYMLCFAGTDGSNNFGSAPNDNPTWVKVVFWLMVGLTVLGTVAAIAVPLMFVGALAGASS